MKIRTDFVTNSSSSSFILGIPNGNTVNVKDAKKYLKEIQNQLGVDGIYCEHIIDLRYDPNKKYEESEVSAVAEAILWYSLKEDDQAESTDDELIWFIDETGEYHEICCYSENRSKAEIKGILDYAYEHFGEILVGSNEQAFYPYEAFDNYIAYNDSIKYKCNHMG